MKAWIPSSKDWIAAGTPGWKNVTPGEPERPKRPKGSSGSDSDESASSHRSKAKTSKGAETPEKPKHVNTMSTQFSMNPPPENVALGNGASSVSRRNGRVSPDCSFRPIVDPTPAPPISNRAFTVANNQGFLREVPSITSEHKRRSSNNYEDQDKSHYNTRDSPLWNAEGFTEINVKPTQTQPSNPHEEHSYDKTSSEKGRAWTFQNLKHQDQAKNSSYSNSTEHSDGKACNQVPELTAKTQPSSSMNEGNPGWGRPSDVSSLTSTRNSCENKKDKDMGNSNVSDWPVVDYTDTSTKRTQWRPSNIQQERGYDKNSSEKGQQEWTYDTNLKHQDRTKDSGYSNSSGYSDGKAHNQVPELTMKNQPSNRMQNPNVGGGGCVKKVSCKPILTDLNLNRSTTNKVEPSSSPILSPKSQRKYDLLRSPAISTQVTLDLNKGPIQYGLKKVWEQFFGRPFDWTLKSQFTGKLLGFDKRSFAYIQILDNKKQAADFKLLKKEIAEHINSPKDVDFSPLTIRQIALNELMMAQISDLVFARVRVLAIRVEDGLVLVLDVDEEKMHEVAASQLHRIQGEFLQLSFMSIRCQLFGLEHLIGTDAIGTVLGRLHGSTTMKMTVIDKTNIPTVIMVPKGSKESINQMVKKAISKFNPFPGPFEKDMEIKYGKIIRTDGKQQHIWYQIQSPILDYLTNLFPTKVVPEEREELNLLLISDGVTTFAAPNKSNPGFYVRISIIPNAVRQKSNVRVSYIDTGMETVVPVKDLIPYEYFDGYLLSKITPQCVKFGVTGSDSITQDYLDDPKVQAMNHTLYIYKLPKDGNPTTVDIMIYFSKDEERKLRNENYSLKKDDDKPNAKGKKELKRLAIVDDVDFVIHRYDPMFKNPLAEYSARGRGFPAPFDAE